MVSDFLSINDLTDKEIATVLETGEAFRRRMLKSTPLAGKSVALIFEKPSLRTKVSFDVGVHELGGHPIFITREEVGLDTREPVEDAAHVLERWVSIIVARVFTHRTLERLAAASSVPVINALSDIEHPCQAMADLLTIRQHAGRLDGKTVAFVGDANNVAYSLALGCAAVGANFRFASPSAYGFSREMLDAVHDRYKGKNAGITAFTAPAEAVKGAEVVYTDVWTSMGQEAETAVRKKAFAGFQVNPELMKLAAPNAIFMHDMPAHYGEEVPPGMLEHPQSVAFDQAENRLHAQKAVLQFLAAR